MILQTILRWLWIAFVFCLSAFFAIVALFMMGSFWAGEAFRDIAEAHGDAILWHGSDIFGALFFTGAVAPALTAVPALAAMLLGELMRIRSGLYYTLAGGAAMAAIPLLAGPRGSEVPATPAPSYMTLFAAAGFLGGFIYWLLAGRKA